MERFAIFRPPVCRRISLHAAEPVFKPICLRLAALGLRLRYWSPAGRVALQAAGRIAVWVAF